jgi:hypothetical protein
MNHHKTRTGVQEGTEKGKFGWSRKKWKKCKGVLNRELTS